MKTLLLDIVVWDLVLDAAGNIAVASEPYSLAQDAASAARLFKGELYYDKTKGIPYFENILAAPPPIPLMKAKYVSAAKSVPGIAAAKCFLTTDAARKIGGQIQIADAQGQTAVASF